MKVLIQGHCSLKSQMDYFKAHFPDWDVRGVLTPQSNAWITEKNEKFLEFVGEIDIFFGLTEHGLIREILPENVRKIHVNPFAFNGYHPDTKWIQGAKSPLEIGIIHSAIIASAYLLGKTQAETINLFTDAQFNKLGYYDVFEQDKKRVIKVFQENSGIDISSQFEIWNESGNFLYTPNHPQSAIFFDIAHLAMKTAGYTENVDADALAQTRAGLDDYFGGAIIWALHPEIAAHHGVKATPDTWRLSAAKGAGTHYDLAAFISKSYETYDQDEGVHEKMKQAIGGDEKLAFYGEH